MRVTGAGDPTVPVSETLEGKLPQRKLVTTAAAHILNKAFIRPPRLTICCCTSSAPSQRIITIVKFIISCISGAKKSHGIVCFDGSSHPFLISLAKFLRFHNPAG